LQGEVESIAFGQAAQCLDLHALNLRMRVRKACGHGVSFEPTIARSNPLMQAAGRTADWGAVRSRANPDKRPASTSRMPNPQSPARPPDWFSAPGAAGECGFQIRDQR
jgi:hypothetical protein